jgi:BirA family biotin operon repressor/biotin-[acetyl-CoA-carboxylase] ligase
LATERDKPLPALVVADRQTAGRGRGENRWWSSEGALTFSLLLDATDERLPAARWPLVSLGAALAIAAVLQPLVDAEVRLKWPNDVFVAGRKICGILVEAPPVRPARLIVGVGLNVNNSLEDAPDDVQVRATSLFDQTGQAFDREALLGQLVECLLREVERLASDDFQLVARWSPHCLLTGKNVWVEANDREIVGRCAGIDRAGALLLHTSAGLERLFAGVVKRWE